MVNILTGKLFKNILAIIFSVFLFLSCVAIATAQQNGDANGNEKTIIIKGLYIGMDIDEAKRVTEKLLGPDWVVSAVGLTTKTAYDYRFVGGEEKIFGGLGNRAIASPPITGSRGFAIQNKKTQSFEGFVSTDAANKVERISLSGKLVDHIFSCENIYAQEFQEEFRKSYNLPDLYWIPHGWTYPSAKGYTLRIMIDKLVDVKKEEILIKDNNSNAKIQFN
jgi:hypothetical protein